MSSYRRSWDGSPPAWAFAALLAIMVGTPAAYLAAAATSLITYTWTIVAAVQSAPPWASAPDVVRAYLWHGALAIPFLLVMLVTTLVLFVKPPSEFFEEYFEKVKILLVVMIPAAALVAVANFLNHVAPISPYYGP